MKENEADRFSVVEFGIDVDDAIALAKRLGVDQHALKSPEKETFKTTHPLEISRIKHFAELRREVELRKAHNTPPPHINWKELAQHYVKRWSKYKKQ